MNNHVARWTLGAFAAPLFLSPWGSAQSLVKSVSPGWYIGPTVVESSSTGTSRSRLIAYNELRLWNNSRLRAIVTDSSFRNPQTVIIDDRNNAKLRGVAWVNGARSWCVLISNGLDHEIVVRRRDLRFLLRKKSGILGSTPADAVVHPPVIAGGTYGNHALLLAVRRRSVLDGREYSLVTQRFDAATLELGEPRVLLTVRRDQSSSSPFESIAVTPLRGEGPSWRVAYSLDDVVSIQRVNAQGGREGAPVAIAQYGSGVRNVRIAGMSGHYALAIQEELAPARNDDGFHLIVMRWSTEVRPQTVGWRPLLRGRWELTDLRYDRGVDRHWMLAMNGVGGTRVVRVGYTGGIIHTAWARSAALWRPISLSYDESVDRFAVAFPGPSESQGPGVYGFESGHSPGLMRFAYGRGCGGTISSSLPVAGTENFRVSLAADSQFANRYVWLRVSPRPVTIPLAGGCVSYVDMGAPGAFSLSRRTGVFANATATFALPDDPVLLGPLFMQWQWWQFSGTGVITKTSNALYANVTY